MAYLDGFVTPVPADGREAYADYARRAWALFQKAGATAMRECWGDDVPEGVHTSFPMAVKLEPGEVVVFSWLEWPDRATRDACHAGMRDNPDFAALGAMPFDGKRMIYGGFTVLVDAR